MIRFTFVPKSHQCILGRGVLIACSIKHQSRPPRPCQLQEATISRAGRKTARPALHIYSVDMLAAPAAFARYTITIINLIVIIIITFYDTTRMVVLEENGFTHNLQRALVHARMHIAGSYFGDFLQLDAAANGLQVRRPLVRVVIIIISSSSSSSIIIIIIIIIIVLRSSARTTMGGTRARCS